MAYLPPEAGRSSHAALRRVRKRVARRRQAIAITIVVGLSFGVAASWHAVSAPRGNAQLLARTKSHSGREVATVAAFLPVPQALRSFHGRVNGTSLAASSAVTLRFMKRRFD